MASACVLVTEIMPKCLGGVEEEQQWDVRSSELGIRQWQVRSDLCCPLLAAAAEAPEPSPPVSAAAAALAFASVATVEAPRPASLLVESS
ncbi:hypothetical protein ABZP36_031754 [Zizania latifolia]